MDVKSPEDMMRCPYNPAHMVRVMKMQAHLMKCKKQHALTEMASCPFNASHEVRKEELRFHLTVCPDRRTVQHQVFADYAGDSAKGCTELPEYKPLSIGGESWDSPYDAPANHARGSAHPAEMPFKQDPKPRLEEEETKRLNPRQRQRLYLQKKAEEEALKQALRGNQPALREPQQEGWSQSLAMLQHQQKAASPEAKPPVFGRGRGRGLGAKPPLGSQVGMRGDSQTPAAAPPPSIPSGYKELGVPALETRQPYGAGTPFGRGTTGGLSSPAGSQGGMKNFYDPQGTQKAPSPSFQQTPWQGGVGRASSFRNAQSSDIGDAPSSFGGNMGPGRGQSSFGGNVGLGRGQSSFGGGYVGLGRSQSSFGGNGGLGRGQSSFSGRGGLGTAPWSSGGGEGQGIAQGSFGGTELRTDSSDEGEQGQYQDAVGWIGGGYGDGPDNVSMASSSTTSLVSNPPLLGTWAEYMDRIDDSELPASAEPSIGDLQDHVPSPGVCVQQIERAQKELRKIQKKLREIEALQTKINEGMKLEKNLEKGEVDKLKSKDSLIQRASEIQQILNTANTV